MAVIDLKNTTVKLYDGKDLVAAGATTIGFTAPEADMVFQPKIMASPDAPITITFVDPGATGSLGVVVTGRNIVVNLAWATSAVTTTAALAKAAIEATPAAHALVGITYATGEDGTGLLNGVAITTLTNPNAISVKIGTGNITHSEKRPVEFRLDRGRLDTVREADQEPMDVSFDFTWEEITAASGASVPTIEDALKRLGLAADWYNASTDPCRPSCVNISVNNNPSCSGVAREVTEIKEFYQETLDHDPSAGQVTCAGRANSQYATSVRVAS